MPCFIPPLAPSLTPVRDRTSLHLVSAFYRFLAPTVFLLLLAFLPSFLPSIPCFRRRPLAVKYQPGSPLRTRRPRREHPRALPGPPRQREEAPEKNLPPCLPLPSPPPPPPPPPPPRPFPARRTPVLLLRVDLETVATAVAATMVGELGTAG